MLEIAIGDLMDLPSNHTMTPSYALRERFFSFFTQHNHTALPSASLLPQNDPSLLFVNAGMNPFKPYFLGEQTPQHRNVTTIQRCLRMGGKHNDLENVGHTRRHLTFFEMMGNFSFGGYFKEEAIDLSWKFSTEVLQLDPARIWPTIYLDDEQSYTLWRRYVPHAQITRFGADENYWSMGDTGPRGPCSELLYDLGPHAARATHPLEDHNGERFLEFWNLVFMQDTRLDDGTLQPLPQPCIDTGAGLERVLMVCDGVNSVFETYELRGLISAVEQLCQRPYRPNTPEGSAMAVLADHSRMLCYAIADGMQPSNVERGYVLRKALRRALRYARTLNLSSPVLPRLIQPLIDMAGSFAPQLLRCQERLALLLEKEETQFDKTLYKAERYLKKAYDAASTTNRSIAGHTLFMLKDTYGMPLEEMQLWAKDHQLQLDLEGYQKYAEEAAERSRQQQVYAAPAQQASALAWVQEHGESTFVGYTEQSVTTTITGLWTPNMEPLTTLHPEEPAIIALAATPFYAAMGGQIGDQGKFLTANRLIFSVEDTQSPCTGMILHHGRSHAPLHIGQTLEAAIDPSHRAAVARAHSATHLLHWALTQVLGSHVRQAGSKVEPDLLRFDFQHHAPLTVEQKEAVESLITRYIVLHTPITCTETAYSDVRDNPNIKQFFGDKYGERVRVVSVGPSQELCGGCHAENTGAIGSLFLRDESAIASGTRRIYAVVGPLAVDYVHALRNQLSTAAQQLNTTPTRLHHALSHLQEERTTLLQEKEQLIQNLIQIFIQQKKESWDRRSPLLIPSYLPLRATLCTLVEKLNLATAIGYTEDTAKITVAMVQQDGHVREFFQKLMQQLGGKGGGKGAYAQGVLPSTAIEALRGYILHD